MRRIVTTLCALVALASVGIAAAGSVGTVTTTGAGTFAGAGGSGAPTVYASDHFTGTSGTSLNGRSLVLGNQKWTVVAGTWTINANQAEISGVPLGRVVTPTGQANVRLIATVADSGAGGRTSGVVFRSDAAAGTFLSAYTQAGSGGRIFLAKRVSGVSTVLASFSGVAFTSPATFVVECNGANIKVSYNGTTYLDQTLLVTDQLVFGSLSSHGLLNDNAALVRYDDFRVESL